MFRLLSIAFLISLTTGLDPAMAQAPTRRRRTPAAPDAADPRSQHARLCHGERITRRRQRSGERRRKLHPRPHAQPRAGDDRAGRRAAGNGLQLHHGIGRQQDLSRHRARAQHLRHARPHRPRQADRHHQPPRSLHPPGGGVCPQTIRPRHGRAVHRRGGRTRPRVVHGPGQSDRPAPGAGDDCHLHRQRQRRRPGKRARPGIRHHVRPVRGVRREGSAASGGEAIQRETDQRSRRPGDDGRQFRRLVRLDHGVVSPGAVPPRSHLLGHLREPAVAVEPRDSRTAHGSSTNT